MTITRESLTFDHTADYMEQHAVVSTEAGERFRIRIVTDTDPHAPDGDYGLPTYTLGVGYYGGRTLVDVQDSFRTDYGSYAHARDGMSRTLSEVFDHFFERSMSLRAALVKVDRYLRVFHNGGLVITSAHPYRDTIDLVSYWTETMLTEAFGYTTATWPDPEQDMKPTEWIAYFEGECYGYVVEQADVRPFYPVEDIDDLDWDEVDSCWGYYGEDDAIDEALSVVNHHARPLGALRLA